MIDYDKQIKNNTKRNEKFIKEFEKWLIDKGLTERTIQKHISNVDLYINDYLNYSDITKAEDGMGSIHSFLCDWFIEKCSWSSENSLKETASSIKKFYQYMSENKYVDSDEYKYMCDFVKKNMKYYLKEVAAYWYSLFNDEY